MALKDATLFDVLCDCAVRSAAGRQEASVVDGEFTKIIGFYRSFGGNIGARLGDGSVVDACVTLASHAGGGGVALGLGVVEFVERLGAESVMHFAFHAADHSHVGECSVVVMEGGKKKGADEDIRTVKRDVGRHITTMWERIAALESIVARLVTKKHITSS